MNHVHCQEIIGKLFSRLPSRLIHCLEEYFIHSTFQLQEPHIKGQHPSARLPGMAPGKEHAAEEFIGLLPFEGGSQSHGAGSISLPFHRHHAQVTGYGRVSPAQRLVMHVFGHGYMVQKQVSHFRNRHRGCCFDRISERRRSFYHRPHPWKDRSQSIHLSHGGAAGGRKICRHDAACCHHKRKGEDHCCFLDVHFPASFSALSRRGWK